MKTKLLKVSKCTLSFVLSLMMLFSSVFVSSGVTTTATAADTPDTIAADTAQDTAQADDTTAPAKSAAPAKVTPQASGAIGDTSSWRVIGRIYGASSWQDYNSSSGRAFTVANEEGTLLKYTTTENITTIANHSKCDFQISNGTTSYGGVTSSGKYYLSFSQLGDNSKMELSSSGKNITFESWASNTKYVYRNYTVTMYLDISDLSSPKLFFKINDADNSTIYFKRPTSNWTNPPKAYIYNDENNLFTFGWAGTEMVLCDDANKIYKIDLSNSVSTGSAMVIFNNNASPQLPSSGDGYVINPGTIYSSDGKTDVSYDEWESFYVQTDANKTIYFIPPTDWGTGSSSNKMYCYAWKYSGDLAIKNGDFRATEMTYDSENNRYYTTLSRDYPNVIFSNSSNQTVDLTITGSNNLFTGSNTKNGNKYTGSWSVTTNSTPYTIYFDATASNWSTTPSATITKASDGSSVSTGSMTKETSITNANIYKFTFASEEDASALNVAFSNGTDTTTASAVVDGKVYTKDGNTNRTLEEQLSALYKQYIYFEKPVYLIDSSATPYTYTTWDTAKAYLFGGTTTTEIWPGYDMTVDTATGLYRLDVTGKDITTVVFNNGNKKGTINRTKTADLTLEKGKVYTYDGTIYDYDDYKNQIDDWYVLGVDSSETQMSPVAGEDGLYVLNTKKTIAQLLGGITFRRKYNNEWIGDPLGSTTKSSDSSQNLKLTSSTAGNGSSSKIDLGARGYYLSFASYGTAPAGTVKLYLDVSSLASPKFYYEVNSYTITSTDETATSYTFYLDNSECGWDAPAAYAYSNPDANTQEDVTSGILNAVWPGTAMTFDTVKNLWKITVSLKKQTFSDNALTSQYPQVIFTDKFINAAGKEIKTGMHQTAAQQLVDGKVYKIASNGSVTTTDYSSYTKPTTPALTYHVHNVSSGADTAMTETSNGSGIYKLSTSKTIADLSVDSEHFYIVEKGYRGNISHRRPSNSELDQFDRNDKFETHERASGYFFFNDSSVTAGNVDLYYQPSTEKFWYTFAADPQLYTVTASDATTKSALGFEEKSYVAGSTATLKIVRIPEGKAVDSVTAGNTALTPNESGEYTFTVDANKTVTVTLRNKYTFNITMASTDNAATVTASQYTVTEGEQIKINAIKGVSDEYDYTFNNWTATGCDLKFVNSKATEAAAVVIPTANSSTSVTNGVANITITANYNKTQLTNVTANGNTYYISYGVEKEYPQNFDNIKSLKSLTINGETKYFADFVKSDFLKDGGNTASYINFSLTTSSTAPGYENFIGRHQEKEVSSTKGSVVTGGNHNHNINNENEATHFAQMLVNDWDSLIAVRIYVDGLNGDTQKVSGNKYTFDPIYQEVKKKDQVGNVKFYVKDGTIRYNFQKYTDLADTTVTNNSSSGTDTGIHVTERKDYNERAESGYGEVGATLSIKTTIQQAYVNKYYVKGFCVNGVTYNVIDEPAAGDARRIKSGETGYDLSKSGVYTLDYVLPANTDTVEITPIYFYFTDSTSDMVKKQPNVKFITFYAEDFDTQVQNTWGSTLAVHAWYSGDEADEKTGGANDNKNTLGGYPGQPMVFANGEGRYYMQIPTIREDGKTIQGVTMNNYDWDDVHAYVTWGVSGTDEPRQAKNCQTYDYDDFDALAYYGAEEIFFTFKYRTNTDNPSDNAALMNKSYYGNGWDAFVDHESRGVDLFGNRLKKSDTLRDDSVTYQSKDSSNTYLSVDSAYLTEDFIESANCDNKIYITSDGYVNYESNSKYRYLGKYATKWTIYKKNGSSFTNIGALPSSAFVPPMDGRSYKLNDDGEMITTGTDGAANKALFLAYSGTADTARETEWSEFVTIYNACHHFPAVITYEIAKVDSNQPGLRNDGRWYYSKEAERRDDVDLYSIVGNIQIEYKNIGSSGYTTDTISDAGLGSTTNATAKFTDTDMLTGSTSIKEITILDKTKNYNFHADAVSTTTGATPKTYVFVGWFLKNGDNYTKINPSDLSNPDGSCPRLSSETFVARYEEVSGKTLIVNHETGTATGENVKNGSGKTYTTVKVFNPTTNSYIFNQTSEGAITVSPNYLTDNNYKVTIEIKAEADKTSRYNATTVSYDKSTPDTQVLTTDANNTVGTATTYNAVTVSSLFGEADSKRIDYVSTFTFSTFTVYYCFYDRDTTHNAKIDIKKTPTKVQVDVPYAADDTIAQIITNGMNETVTNGDGSMSKLSNILDKYYFWTTQTEAQGHTDGEDYVGGIASMEDISKTPVQSYGTTYKSSTASLKKHFDSLGKPVDKNTYSAVDIAALTAQQLTENWINYGIDNNGTIEYKTFGSLRGASLPADESDYTPSNTGASNVVVWCYNTPKTYRVDFIYPKADTEEQTTEVNGEQVTTTVQKYNVSTDNIAINSVLTKSGYTDVYTYDYYTDDKTWADANWTRASLFYGQRLGESESGVKLDNDGNLVDKDGKLIDEITDERDLPGGHIQNYGVKLGFNDTKIEAVKEFTKTFVDSQSNEEIEKTLVFDGWYDIDSGAKITSDYNYGYRVTSDMTLVAGYKIKPEEAVTKTPRVTVTADDFDMYFVENSGADKTTMTEKMRFNTQLNVYDCADDYSGTGKIEKIAAAYVQLRVQGEGTKYTTRSAYELANDSGFITALKRNIEEALANKSSDPSPATGWFKYQRTGDDKAYSVAWKMVYTFKTAEDVSGSEYLATLTNKNRTIFTMDIDASKYEENESISAMLVFGAIKINNEWTLSDNFVKYINYDAPDEDEAGTEEPQGEDDGDGGEGSVEGGSVQENP